MMKKMTLIMLFSLVFSVCMAPTNNVIVIPEGERITIPFIPKADRILLAHQMWESRKDSTAYNPIEDAVGIMQITPIAVRETNRILKRHGIAKRYSLKDRWSVKKSVEMWYIIQQEYNPEYDLTIASRVWNSGTTRQLKSTQAYCDSVKVRYLRI